MNLEAAGKLIRSKARGKKFKIGNAADRATLLRAAQACGRQIRTERKGEAFIAEVVS